MARGDILGGMPEGDIPSRLQSRVLGFHPGSLPVVYISVLKQDSILK